MALTNDQLLERISVLELKVNTLQTASNNLATRKEMKNLFALMSQQLSELLETIRALELANIGPAYTDHLNEDNPHPQYVINDGTINITGDLDLEENSIINVDLVDGRDISADATVFEAHIAESGIHFTMDDIDLVQYHTDERADSWLASKSTTDIIEGNNLYYTEDRVAQSPSVSANTILSHNRLHDITGSDDHNNANPSDYGKFIRANPVSGVIEFASVVPGGGVSEHGDLIGLSDDDHLQYLTEARADSWFLTKTLNNLSDVSDSDTPTKNDVLIYNGNEWLFAPYNTSFIFSISSFSSNIGSTTIEIGTGTWKSIGSISFSATYSNGPATNAYVSLSGWSNLTMTGTNFVGPTLNTETINFPSVGTTKVFTLNATDGSDNSNSSLTYYFYNRRYWGYTTKTSTFLEADIKALAGTELSNSKSKTFSSTTGAGQYILYCYPSRLGTATFTVGGFSGGFLTPETVSVTNSSGYTEDYYVYRSTNSNLGTITVVAN